MYQDSTSISASLSKEGRRDRRAALALSQYRSKVLSYETILQWNVLTCQLVLLSHSIQFVDQDDFDFGGVNVT